MFVRPSTLVVHGVMFAKEKMGLLCGIKFQCKMLTGGDKVATETLR